MNSPSSRTNTSCSLCILLLLLLAIRDTSSFYSIPKIIHSRCISADVKSEKRSQIWQRITYVQNNFQRGTIISSNSLEATTTTYLDSLNDITSNPHLFPTTSDYIKTLSSQSSEGDTTILDAAPSAEEFLTQLSTELLKASENNNELIFGVPQQTYEPTTTTVSSASAASAVADAENTIHRIAEFIGPAFSSALGVSVAASTYNPAYYSHLMASTNIDYTKGATAADGIAFAATNVMGNEGSGIVERVVSDAASSTLMQDVTEAVASSGDKVAQRIAESTAPIESATGNNMASSMTTTTATSIANSIDDATNNLGDKVTGAIENIASKASISVANAAGGGVTTEDAVESFSSWHKSEGGSPNSLRDLASSIPTIDGQQVLDFTSRNGIDAGGNTATGLSDVGNIVANAYASSSEVFAAQASSSTEGGGGGSILSQLASSIPTDIEELNQVREQMNQVSEQATTTAASTTMQDITSAVASSGDNSVGLDTASAVTSIDTVGLDTMSAAADSTNEVVSNTLSSQLSDLSYDGLTNSESAHFPSTSAKAPLLSDLINDKVQHVEMPKMTNPFSDGVPPSMDNAFSSIKEASEASKDMLESAFGSMSHTIDGLHLGDKVPDLSNSFEGLSDQLASGTKAIGNVVQRSERGWSAIGSKVTEQARKSNINHLQAPEMNIPKLNIKMPKIDIHPPAANLNFEAPAELIPQPNFPNVEIHPPPLPNLHVISEGASSALHQVSDRVGDTSLSAFGNAIVSAITFMGGIIVKFLDLILGAATGGGTSSVTSLLSSVHDSITSTIDSASHAITLTLMNIGNMSIIEIIEHLLALVIAISDILLKIMNAVIYLISGKDGTGWALMATSSINEASSQLLAQASSTYDDVTHTSLSQLAHTVGDYSNYVGNEFITVMGSLNHNINGGGSLVDGISLPDETLDGVATAVQTALSL